MSDLLREKVIPVGLLIVALFIPAFGIAVTAKADDLSPRVVNYVNTFHDAVCETLTEHPSVEGVTGVAIAVMGGGFTGTETGQIIAASILGWCPQHTAVMKAAADRWTRADKLVTA